MTRAKSKKKGAVSAKHCTTASILNLSPLSFSLLKSALTSINGAMLAASVDASPRAMAEGAQAPYPSLVFELPARLDHAHDRHPHRPMPTKPSIRLKLRKLCPPKNAQ
jgi:hypothetical protein